MVKMEVYKPNKKEDKKLKNLNNNLVKPPFRWILVGYSGSGKTNFIKNIIFNNKLYKPYFDEIYIFCGSLDDCDEYRELIKKNRMKKRASVFGGDLDLDEIKNLYDEIELENSTKKDPSRVLFVFDDHITSGISRRNRNTIIDTLFVKGRHANVSTILSTQKYTMLNQNLRVVNATAITVFGSNLKELEKISEEHSNLMTKEEFLEILKYTQNKKYNSITVNYTNDIDKRFLDKNLNPLVIQYEEDF